MSKNLDQLTPSIARITTTSHVYDVAPLGGDHDMIEWYNAKRGNKLTRINHDP